MTAKQQALKDIKRECGKNKLFTCVYVNKEKLIRQLVALSVVILTGCAPVYDSRLNNPPYMTDTLKWNEFVRCSSNEGDAGTEDCWYRIFNTWEL